VSLYLPQPSTWSTAEVITAPQLRADFAGTIQLLSHPPMFIGAQTLTSQVITADTNTPVTLDTEVADSVSGHFLTTDSAQYFGQFPGWYLAEVTAPLNYTGGGGAFAVGVQAQQNGTATTKFGMRMPNTSGSFSVASGARLCQIAVTGVVGGSGDFIAMSVNQTGTGAFSWPLLNGTSRFPRLACRWVCALSGTAPLPVPSNDAFPPPSTTLTGTVAAGGTQMVPASLTGMTFYGGQGTTLGLDIGTPAAENVVMTGPAASGTVPITPAAHAHASGAAVSVPVDAPFFNKNVRDAAAFLLYPPVMQRQYLGGSPIPLGSSTGLPAIGQPIQLFSATMDNYSASNSNGWIAPVGGLYYAHGCVAIASNATTTVAAAGLTITSANYNSGTTFTLWGGGQSAVNSDPAASVEGLVTACTVTRYLRLNAGDAIALAGFQHDTSGLGATLLGSGNYSCRLITIWEGA